MVAFLINVSVISVSGAVCNSPDLNMEDQMSCNDLDLNKASFLLRVRVILATFYHIHIYLMGFGSSLINVVPFFLQRFCVLLAECIG